MDYKKHNMPESKNVEDRRNTSSFNKGLMLDYSMKYPAGKLKYSNPQKDYVMGVVDEIKKELKKDFKKK